MTTAKKYKFLIAYAAWGQEAIDNSYRYLLWSLKFPGNLDALKEHDVIIKHYADPPPYSGSYDVNIQHMISFQQRAASWAFAEDRYLIWLYPDTMLLPNSLSEILEAIDFGYEFGMYQGVTLWPGAANALIDYVALHEKYQLGEFSNSYLMYQLIQTYIHPVSETKKLLFPQKGDMFTIRNNWPLGIYSDINGIFSINAFHSNPIFIKQRKDASICKTPLDGDFVYHAGLADTIPYWPSRFTWFEIAKADKTQGCLAEGQTFGYEDLLKWAFTHATDWNLKTFARNQIIGVTPRLKRETLIKFEKYDFINYFDFGDIVKFNRKEAGYKCVTS